MGKSSLSVLAITLTILGTAVTAGHPAWGTITGLAILLLAAGIAAGALPVRSPSDGYIVDRRDASQKISSNLVTLSSAAILAIYAAGYHRTGSAADKFDVQTAQRSTASPIATAVVAPKAAIPGIEAPAKIPRSAAAPVRKDYPRPSPAAVPKAAL